MAVQREVGCEVPGCPLDQVARRLQSLPGGDVSPWTTFPQTLGDQKDRYPKSVSPTSVLLQCETATKLLWRRYYHAANGGMPLALALVDRGRAHRGSAYAASSDRRRL